MIRRFLIALRIVFKREVIVFVFDKDCIVCNQDMWAYNLRSLKHLLDETGKIVDIKVSEQETVWNIQRINELKKQLENSVN